MPRASETVVRKVIGFMDMTGFWTAWWRPRRRGALPRRYLPKHAAKIGSLPLLDFGPIADAAGKMAVFPGPTKSRINLSSKYQRGPCVRAVSIYRGKIRLK